MKTKFIRNILILCVLFGTSCVEKYTPEIVKYENVLVVDGMITAEPGPYTIKLSTSSEISKAEYNPYPKAEVIIYDDLGNSEILTENNPGEYKTTTDGFRGVVGRKYKIQINTLDNKIYFSDFEKLIASVEIDSVYANIESKGSSYHPYDLIGLQFYLDTELSTTDTNYYLWKLESTYKFNSSFLISYIYDKYHLTALENRDTLFTCWKTDILPEIIISNTVNLTEPKITNFPLNYVSTEDRDLSIKYSLLVKQFTITEKAYNFWNKVEEINSDQGSLFSVLPYQIRGNMYCENDSEEPVLGYFMAAGISEKRIFVDRPELAFHYWQCYLTRADFERYGYIRWTPSCTWPLYVVTSQNGYRALPHQDCVDCTRKGGYVNKPEFWTE